MDNDFARLCRMAQAHFTCKRVPNGYLLTRRSNGKIQVNLTSITMCGKTYNRNAIIAYCNHRRPAPKGSAPAFRVTGPQSLFFSKCIDLLFTTILRLIRSNHYQIFDAVAFVVHALYLHLAHERKRQYRQKLYATPRGYRKQCAVLNGILSFGKCLPIMLNALKEWKPVKLPPEQRKRANRMTKAFLNWASQVRRDERQFRFDAILCVLHKVLRKNASLKGRVRRGEASMFEADMDLIQQAMNEAITHLGDTLSLAKIGAYTHARVSSGFYNFCRKRLYSCLTGLTFLEKYKLLEDIPMLMNDLGMHESRGHVKYGANHMLMAINATGRMDEFLDYFEWHVQNTPRLKCDTATYTRGRRNADLVFLFTQKHTTDLTGFTDIDIIRVVRDKTGKPVERAKPSDIKNALMELEEELPHWNTFRSLNAASCK